jgi:hypothetical protein
VDLHDWPKYFTNTDGNYEEMRDFVERNVGRFDLLVIEIPGYSLQNVPDWYIPTIQALGAQLGLFSISNCEKDLI